MLFIIVPIRDEEKNLINLFRSIDSQVDQNFNVLFVDNGSTDKSAEILQDYVKGRDRRSYLYHGEKGQINTYLPGLNYLFENKDDVKFVATVDADSKFNDVFWSYNANRAINDNPDCKFFISDFRYTDLENYPNFLKGESIQRALMKKLMKDVYWYGLGTNSIFDAQILRGILQEREKIIDSLIFTQTNKLECPMIDFILSLQFVTRGYIPRYFSGEIFTSSRRLFMSKQHFDGYVNFNIEKYIHYLKYGNSDDKNTTIPDLNYEQVLSFLLSRASKLVKIHILPMIYFDKQGVFIDRFNKIFKTNLSNNTICSLDQNIQAYNLWFEDSFEGLLYILSKSELAGHIEDTLYNEMASYLI